MATLRPAHALEAFNQRMYVWREPIEATYAGLLNDGNESICFRTLNVQTVEAAKLRIASIARDRALLREPTAKLLLPMMLLDQWTTTVLKVK